MKAPKKTWFGAGDADDVTLNKAFLLGGIVTADSALSAAKDISSLKAGVQRRIAPRRVSALPWVYPSAGAKPATAPSVFEIAKIYDDTLGKRGGDWANALRLEIPIEVANDPKIGGIAGLTPEQIYELLGIGLDDGTDLALALTFAATPARSRFAFNWPMRVVTADADARNAWAVKNGYVGLVDPDDAARFDTGGPATGVDLYLDQAPDTKESASNSIITIPEMDIADFGTDDWRHLMDMGRAVVVPNVSPQKLTPWLDELTRAITHDRPFDVAVFEAWHKSGQKTPPVLVAWEGAFDKAKLSTLVDPTIRSLRSYPAKHPVTIPADVARDLGVTRPVPAGKLAKTIEDAVKRDAPPMQFDRENRAGRTLGRVRPQLKEFVPFSAGGAAASEARTASASPPGDAAAGATRFVNAWLEDGAPPLERDRPYTLAINIGRLRDQSLGSEILGDIDWGDKTSLMLLCVVSGHGVSVSPGQRTFELTPAGDTKKILFTITALRASPIALRISLYLARELTLLEEFEVTVAVQKAKAA